MPPKPVFRRALKNQQHPIFVLAIILAVSLALLVPSARLFLYDVYANRHVSIKSWFKPWRDLPVEDGLWNGVRDLASERKRAELEHGACKLGGSDDVVPCHEIDGATFPVCGSVEAVGDCLKSEWEVKWKKRC